MNDDGGVVALHNSWDDDNGQRHAVPLAQMRAFVASTEPLPADDDEVEVIEPVDERPEEGLEEDGDDVRVVDGPDDLAPLAVRLAARPQQALRQKARLLRPGARCDRFTAKLSRAEQCER